MSTNDYRVAPRYAWEIADAATAWRRLAAEGLDANYFDVCRFLTSVVLPKLSELGRPIELEIVDEEEVPAWVHFADKKLCIRSDVWAMACLGAPRARLILAHEIGHMVLHGEQVSAFTRGYEYQLNYLEPIESAEMQANWFAWSLLLPDDVLLRLRSRLSAENIALLAMVEERLVIKRLELLQLDKRYRSPLNGDACPQCENFTVVRTGITAACTTCGLQITSS